MYGSSRGPGLVSQHPCGLKSPVAPISRDLIFSSDLQGYLQEHGEYKLTQMHAHPRVYTHTQVHTPNIYIQILKYIQVKYAIILEEDPMAIETALGSRA